MNVVMVMMVIVVIMIVLLTLGSMSIVRERESGTMEQLIVTPLDPRALMVGKLAPYAVVGLIEVLVTTAIAVGWFRVPLRGSLALLVLTTVPFLFCTLGLGLLVSTLVRTQQQAMMSAAYLIMVPMIYLSGLIFPVENMPSIIQKATVVIPLKYYAHIIRGIFLKGSGLDVLWPDAVALLVIGATVLVTASLRFRKSLD
jgi:ABC-2 type transport system permease protein